MTQRAVRHRRFVRGLAPLAVLAMLGCGAAPSFRGEAVTPPVPAPPLEGTNWDGEAFRLAELEGDPAIVFFGYSYCPDVCPFTLAKMKRLYAELGDAADGLAMVFVSVDPKRDTIEKLAGYVPGFDPRFFGVRLERQQLERVQEAFDLTVQYGPTSEGGDGAERYYVDHTGTFFLYDRHGRLRVRHPPSARVEDLLPDVRALLSES